MHYSQKNKENRKIKTYLSFIKQCEKQFDKFPFFCVVAKTVISWCTQSGYWFVYVMAGQFARAMHTIWRWSLRSFCPFFNSWRTKSNQLNFKQHVNFVPATELARKDEYDTRKSKTTTYPLVCTDLKAKQCLFVRKHCWDQWTTDENAGLWSISARIPEATNFCFWATGKAYFFHITLSAGHPGFHG